MADELQADRDLVVSYMHHGGENRDALPSGVFWEVYQAGDGFGKQPPEVLAEINDGYDWSHVRDSTPQGWADMATVLRSHALEIDGPKSPTP